MKEVLLNTRENYYLPRDIISVKCYKFIVKHLKTSDLISSVYRLRNYFYYVLNGHENASQSRNAVDGNLSCNAITTPAFKSDKNMKGKK